MTKTTLLIGFILFLTGCGDNNTKTVNQKKEPIISVNFINNYEADVKGGKLFLKVKADNGIISGFISDHWIKSVGRSPDETVALLTYIGHIT